MSSINKILLVGRLAKDPELKQINDKLSCARLTVVTEHVQRAKDGEQKKEVCFMDCTVWNVEATKASQYLKKGSTVAIEGRVKQEEWIDKTNNTKRNRHVVIADTITYMEKIPALAGQANVEAPAPKPATKPSDNPFEYEEFSF